MYYPTLPPRGQFREVLEQFGGLNRRGNAQSGEFTHMENLSSEGFPFLAQRRGRGLVRELTDPGGLIAKDGLCWVDQGKFYVNGYAADLDLTPGRKQLCSMGAYVIILPDKKWINTLDLSQFGAIEARFTTSSPVTFTLCDGEGREYTGILSGDAAPTEPENLQLWLDQGVSPPVLRQYTDLSAAWTEVAATCVKISSPGIGAAFSQGDGITIRGVEKAPDLNGSHGIASLDNDHLVVTGVLEAGFTQTAPVTLERTMPEVDFLIESGNRLWGCRYGLTAGGQVVNELYASALGDFKNWNRFQGLSTDSYVCSCGTDGPFTGAITYLGVPHFFKEGCVHKVYGSYPANFQVQSTPLRGVGRGCGESLVCLGEVLYYKSPGPICGYDGSLPREVSGPLGELSPGAAVAGATGSKYYVNLHDRDGTADLLVYDTRWGLWHREDGVWLDQLCPWEGELYALSENRLLALLGKTGEPEGPLTWQAVTGKQGLGVPGHKYLSRLTVRLSLEPGAEFSVFARYDFSPKWELLGSLRGQFSRSFSLSLRPRRCDHLELKFQGRGQARIWSVTKTLEEGSEGP